LNQAHKDAGLQTDAGSLSFSLRNEQRSAEQFAERGGGRRSLGTVPIQQEVGTDPASVSAATWRRAAGGVDVSV
jgi:hypothetical protein